MPPPNGLFAAVSVASLGGAMHARGAREAVGSRMQHLLPLAGPVQRSPLILPVSAGGMTGRSQDALTRWSGKNGKRGFWGRQPPGALPREKPGPVAGVLHFLRGRRWHCGTD